MKMTIPTNQLIVLLLSLFLLGCGGSTSEADTGGSTNPPADELYRVRLEGLPVSFQLPVTFQRTRQYLLKDAMTATRYDQKIFTTYDELLKRMEMDLDDDEADIFLDTLSGFNHLVVLNVNQLDFDQDLASIFASTYDQLVGTRNERIRGLSAERISSTINESQGKTMMKVKFLNDYEDEEKQDFYELVYLITDAVQTFVVVEYTYDEEDSEKYLWTMRY
ncbi:MAG: hypothetical protein AAF433_04655 [Bacteroidota bacterium]